MASVAASQGVQRGHVFFVVFVALILSASVRILVEIQRHHAQAHALATTACEPSLTQQLSADSSPSRPSADSEGVDSKPLVEDDDAASVSELASPSPVPPPTSLAVSAPARYHDDFVALQGAPWLLPFSALQLYSSSAFTWNTSADDEAPSVAASEAEGEGSAEDAAEGGSERPAPAEADDASSAVEGVVLDPRRFRLHIKVLAFDRVAALRRCLRSLAAARYDGEPVSLDVLVDHPFSNRSARHPWGPKAERAVRRMHRLLAALGRFRWPHGPLRVSHRWENSGIQPQWVEAWWPESANDFAFVVEDDMEVSPLFYRYLKRLVAHFYYNASNFSPRVYGLSFQRQYFTTGIGGSPVRHPPGTPFLYQLVGTWGQFLFPLPWRDFRLWFDLRRHNASRRPLLEGLKSNAWYIKTGERLWTPWIIKWVFANSMFNLYPSLPGNFSLSVSHRDKGTNFPAARGADARLLRLLAEGDGSRQWWGAALPPASALPRFDLCFHRLRRLPPSRSLEELHSLLAAVHVDKRVALLIVPPGGRDLAHNWACHVQGLANVSNAILLVADPLLADELSAKGHAAHVLQPAADASGLVPSEAAASGSNDWQPGHLQVLITTLTLGYDALLASADSVWRGDVVTVASRLLPEAHDMGGHIDTEDFFSSFFMVRSRPVCISAWSRLVKQWQDSVAHNTHNAEAGQHSANGHMGGWLLGHGLDFYQLETLSLRPGEGSTSSEGVVPMVVPSPATSKRSKIAHMEDMNIWTVDDFDLACTSVVCRRKAL